MRPWTRDCPPVAFRASPLLAAEGPPYRATMTRGWFVGWSGFVGVWWVVLAGSFADDETCSYICFTFGDMLGFLFIPAAIVWSLGLIVLHVALRLRARRP
jgi:hypothetical protein